MRPSTKTTPPNSGNKQPFRIIPHALNWQRELASMSTQDQIAILRHIVFGDRLEKQPLSINCLQIWYRVLSTIASAINMVSVKSRAASTRVTPVSKSEQEILQLLDAGEEPVEIARVIEDCVRQKRYSPLQTLLSLCFRNLIILADQESGPTGRTTIAGRNAYLRYERSPISAPDRFLEKIQARIDDFMRWLNEMD